MCDFSYKMMLLTRCAKRYVRFFAYSGGWRLGRLAPAGHPGGS